MSEPAFGRRDLLKGAVLGGAAAIATVPITSPEPASAQPTPATPGPAAGYAFLNTEEAAFVEALVDHMVPADDPTPKGTDLGINIYMQGPWKLGMPSQGYQLPLTPAELYRAGIAAMNAHCRKTHGKSFDALDEKQREESLVELSSGKLKFDDGLPSRVFWTTVYQTVMEGMFSDPIYGGNRDKAGWRMLGFPGAIAVHRENVGKYRGKKFAPDPTSISDMS